MKDNSFNFENELKNKVQLYLKDKLFDQSVVTNNINNDYDIKTKVQKILLSSKYRKFPITDEIKTMLSNKINYILLGSSPFIFVPSFGGYKHFWTPSYPHADWAEIFNLLFFIEYLKPLHNLTKKEIIVEYLSKDIIVPMMNNIPKEYVDKYISEFKEIIFLFNKWQKNIKFEIHCSCEDYEPSVLFKLMDEKKEDIVKKFNQLDSKQRDFRLKQSEKNYCWNGTIAYNNLTELEKKKIIMNSKIINETFLKVDSELRNGSSKGRKNAIPVLFRNGVGACDEICLNLCSCPSSIVAFWVGIGILEVRENKIIPRIISRKQYEALKHDLVKIPVDIKELADINDNYKYIYVYPGEIKI